MAHIPVLLNEVLQHLDPKSGENFIDCTVGEGGHALAILKMTAPGGMLLGIDRDADMVARLKERAERMEVKDRFIIEHGSFSDVKRIAEKNNFSSVRGVLFDFGMSSWQLEESGAGFSFQNIEPLDMRFDRTNDGLTAASILNSWPKESIRRVISEFGEERHARRISEKIVEFRKKERILTTDQLAGIISEAIPRGRQRGKINLATRTFQALRIAVNSELDAVSQGVSDAIELLSPGGKVAAISFHSLEDRIIKNIFRENKREGSLKIITKKPISPTQEEILGNPRARSAKLRVAEKL